MKPSVWAGSEASFHAYQALDDKYRMDKVAYSGSPFDEQPEEDPVFGVSTDRKGLTVMEMVAGIPVIKVHGSLVANFRRFHMWFGGEITSYEAINDALNIVSEGGYEQILLDVDSPGGHVRGVDGVTKMIQRVQGGGTTVRGHSDTAAMSAAYWILSTCNSVTGSRMAEFGSIGTMAVIRTYADTEKNMGVTFTVFKEGDYKAIGNPYEKLSDEDKKYIQADLKKANGFFLNHVASNRMLDLENKAEWAEGKTFYASDALRNGLIDQVVDLDDLIGGASAHTTGDIKVLGMKIDPKKLAQIEAGADPKTVLTAAEFKSFTAAREAAEKLAADEAAEKLAADEAAAAEKLAKEAKGEPAAPKGEPEPEIGTGISAKDYTDALKANGRLEGRVEDLTAQLTAAKEALTASQAETVSLMACAQMAVSKLQVATSSPSTTPATAATMVEAFNSLSAKMAKLYPTSRQSNDTPTSEEEGNSGISAEDNYRLARNAQLNLQKG